MSAISLPKPDVKFINDSFNYILTEMSTLSPEKLQLLANFFQLQASKFNTSLMMTRIIAAGSLALGGTLAVSAIGIRNQDAQAAFLIGGALFVVIGIIVGLSQFIIMSQQNSQLSWYNRCIDFIELKAQTV